MMPVQGTKIAAAPDLMQSRPAMMSAPPESAEDEVGVETDEYEDGQSAEAGLSTDSSVDTAAADLPALPSVLPSQGDLPTGLGAGKDEPDGRSLHALLPLKPGGQKGAATSGKETATATPDGTMFSFEATKPQQGVTKSGEASTGLPSDASADSALGIAPPVPSEIPSTDPGMLYVVSCYFVVQRHDMFAACEGEPLASEC